MSHNRGQADSVRQAARAKQMAELLIAFRISVGLELLAAMAALAFGIFLAINGKGMIDLRVVGWVFVGLGLSVGALDLCVLMRRRWARLTRTALGFLGVPPLGYWALKHPEATTSGVFALNLGIFWLGFMVERRTSRQPQSVDDAPVAADGEEH